MVGNGYTIKEDADLRGTNLNEIVWDSTTQWPEGFTPPPSAE